MIDDDTGWLTFPIEVSKYHWGDDDGIQYLSFPRAVVALLKKHGSFTPQKIDVDIDEHNQWKVTVVAWYYDNENLPFRWSGIGLTFEDAQNALIRFMDGWWFERDLA